ncbi:MAG: pilus assembly protein [Boseongicola sp.]|nr:pilus assembly protein [Boseongicola sp.]
MRHSTVRVSGTEGLTSKEMSIERLMRKFETFCNRPFKTFCKQEQGTISVEAVLWLPLYLVFFAMIVDVSNMMHSRSVAMRIIEDANRHAVTGYLTNQEEVFSQIAVNMQSVSDSPSVDVTWTDDDIATVVSYPASDAQIIGLISMFTNIDLTVTSYNRFEI